MKKAIITVIIVILLDQIVKVWVKLNFLHGEAMPLIDDLLFLRFIENPGMAFGLDFGGQWGKLVLSIIRLIAVFIIGKYLFGLIKKGAHTGYVICISLILAGALGNIIDSAVYGLLFDKGLEWNPVLNDWDRSYTGLALCCEGGYAPFFMGHVVDMIHVQFYYPEWMPFGLGGKEVFPPIFNIADSAITIGVVIIILFQGKFFPKKLKEESEVIEEESESQTS